MKIDKFYNFKISMASLRQQCKQRLKVAFDSIRAISGSLTFILVVDETSLKVISSTIKMMELVNYGINSIQKLQLKRKRFNKIDAVYLIHPDSYEHLLNDFADQPQYGSIHILTLTKIPIHIMDQFSNSQSIVKRIKTLKQLNFGFVLYSDNQFIVEKAGRSYCKDSVIGIGSEVQKAIYDTVELLSTVVTSMSEFYIVQIFYSQPSVSNMAQKISLELKDTLQKMFDLYGKYNVHNYTNSAPQTTFLILDRCYDAVTPLVRDFHYLPLLYDMKDCSKHKIQMEKKGEKKKLYTLDENDPIFEKYKYEHISKVFSGISSDFDSFSRQHIGAKVQKSNENDIGLEKMNQLMKKMPQYVQLKDKYSFHMTMANDIKNNFDKYKYRQTGQLEQNLISQISQNGKSLKPADLLSEVIKITDQLPLEQEKVRLYLIALLSLDLKPKDKQILTQKISKCSSYEDVYKKIQKLSGPLLYKMGPKKVGKEELILDRHQPKVQQTVKKISQGSQADLKYIRVGTQIKGKSGQKSSVNTLGRKKIGATTEKTSKPRLIVFFCTAISYNQIRSLAAFEKDYQIIYGSHSFVTQKQYLNLINSMDEEEL